MTAHPHPPFRASGAWAMGETGDASFASDLDRLQQDADASVRRMATRAPARRPGPFGLTGRRIPPLPIARR
jgi:HEAT repeat protein